MSSLPVLLRKYKEVLRRYVESERELADLDRQILAVRDTTPRRRRRATKPIETNDIMRSMLRVMREAKEPLPPREVASRLAITPVKAWRQLKRAVRLGYVERAGNARYIVSNVVPSGL